MDLQILLVRYKNLYFKRKKMVKLAFFGLISKEKFLSKSFFVLFQKEFRGIEIVFILIYLNQTNCKIAYCCV